MKYRWQILLRTIVLALAPLVGSAQEGAPLIHEGIVAAPVAQVWAAYTTQAGLESWMVAHAEIDLRVEELGNERAERVGLGERGKLVAEFEVLQDVMHVR